VKAARLPTPNTWVVEGGEGETWYGVAFWDTIIAKFFPNGDIKITKYLSQTTLERLNDCTGLNILSYKYQWWFRLPCGLVPVENNMVFRKGNLVSHEYNTVLLALCSTDCSKRWRSFDPARVWDLYVALSTLKGQDAVKTG
jgi:hypothetical protein